MTTREKVDLLNRYGAIRKAHGISYEDSKILIGAIIALSAECRDPRYVRTMERLLEGAAEVCQLQDIADSLNRKVNK